jgi:hypothetical protein
MLSITFAESFYAKRESLYAKEGKPLREEGR